MCLSKNIYTYSVNCDSSKFDKQYFILSRVNSDSEKPGKRMIEPHKIGQMISLKTDKDLWMIYKSWVQPQYSPKKLKNKSFELWEKKENDWH